MGLAGIAHLICDGQHRVECVHRALHHDRKVAPAEAAQLALLEQNQVAALEENAAAHDLAR